MDIISAYDDVIYDILLIQAIKTIKFKIQNVLGINLVIRKLEFFFMRKETPSNEEKFW